MASFDSQSFSTQSFSTVSFDLGTAATIEEINAIFSQTEAMNVSFQTVLGPYFSLESVAGNILLESTGKLMIEINPKDQTISASFTTAETIDGDFSVS